MNDLKTTFMNVCNYCVHERPKKAYSLTECKPRGKKLMFMNNPKTTFMTVFKGASDMKILLSQNIPHLQNGKKNERSQTT